MALPEIRPLPPTLANQIAAGEVVERPASVLKELLENALDAGATALHLQLEEAGLTRLVLTDNGHGMRPDQLPLALARHATSKLQTAAGLFGIRTFGFRGEALPSMASVSRLTLTSKTAEGEEAWQITPQGELRPAAHPTGTRVEVADLFYATPARRKFLKSARAESLALEGVIKALLLAQPQLSLKVVEDGATTWEVPAAQGHTQETWLPGLRSRAGVVVGEDFAAQALPVEAHTEAGTLQGLVGPATLHAGSMAKQWLFINGRPVKERGLLQALKQAYADRLPPGRSPLAVLFLSLPYDAVDVNVHPAKTEVRLAQPDAVFKLVLGGVRQALGADAWQPSTATITAQPLVGGGVASAPVQTDFAQVSLGFQAPPQKLWKGESVEETDNHQPATSNAPQQHPLGAALGQVANTYIVAETAAGDLVVIDQHAAHERLVYEQLKAQLAKGVVASQPLLLPAPVRLPPASVQALVGHAAELERWGIYLEQSGPQQVVVTALPQLLAQANPAQLVADLAEDLVLLNPRQTLQDKLGRVLATLACHHSIRAQRRLSLAEQNALLRQMEAEPLSHTCNHGRPTVVKLSLAELERLFARR
ncbi:MAG: DNA mismatch repair endonuclease MutL [Alphaproteobacteria bacterium]|nr:DNA mismatch repair endonuclease MutL [Alphaproteobacteria bacterium]